MTSMAALAAMVSFHSFFLVALADLVGLARPGALARGRAARHFPTPPPAPRGDEHRLNSE